MPTLDESIAQINDLATKINAPTEQDMTREQFGAYVEAQVAKATEEATNGKAAEAKKRLAALKGQIDAHKASYESMGTSGTSVKIQVYQDPWITLPTMKVANPTDVPKTETSNVQNPGDLPTTAPLVEKTSGGLKATDLLKALILVSKASEKSPLRAKLAKSDQGKVLVAKAGEATAILQKIATMFGIEVADTEDLLDCELRWDVGDMISALQSAARLENVMSTLGGTMTLKTETPPAAAPAPVPTAKAANSETLDFVGEVDPIDPLNDGDWPLDLNSDKSPVAKDAFSVKPKNAA
jgi:hypothetical protein